MSILNKYRSSRSNHSVVACLLYALIGLLVIGYLPAPRTAAALSLSPESLHSVISSKPMKVVQPCQDPTQTPTVTSFSATSVIPGDRFDIIGTNFAPVDKDNVVVFTDSLSPNPLQPATAHVESVTGTTKLTVITPYGAGSGTLSIRTPLCTGVSTITLTVGTSTTGSVSGYVLDSKDSLLGVNHATVRFSAAKWEYTSAKGVFMLQGLNPGNKRLFRVNGTTAIPDAYGADNRTADVTQGRDNHHTDFIRLQKLVGDDIAVGGGAVSPHGFAATTRDSNVVGIGQSFLQQSQSQTSRTVNTTPIKTGKAQAVLQVPQNANVRFPDGATSGKLNISVFEPERSPAPLPVYHYSSAIVQIMPFGVTIEPGAKLIFPNRDNLPAKSKAQLFRFDQTENSQTIGRFVEVGSATVSEDGQWVVTAEGAIRETSYYFVSVARDTATLTGQVMTSFQKPIAGAIVIARGQYTYTDVEGNFKLQNVPVIRERDRAFVETDYLRPDGHVLTKGQVGISVVARETTKIERTFILPPIPFNRSPEFTLPGSFTIRVGENRNLGLKVIGLDNKNRSSVTVSGAAFAKVISSGILWCKNYKLNLAPQGNDLGEHELIVTAVDSFGVRTSHKVLVKVIR